jgi:PAS domain S-box-containing protein
VKPGPYSERALILTPLGRDSSIAAALLKEGHHPAHVCSDFDALVREIAVGAGLAVVAEEVLATVDLSPLVQWIAGQPSWSDFPILVLTRRAGGEERNPVAARMFELLGNVAFVERPFHPTTLLSAVRTAARGRRRQYEARARIDELHAREEQLRVAQQAGGIGSFELIPKTGEVIVSDTFRKLWGMAPDAEMSVSEFIKHVHPDDRPLVRTSGTKLPDGSLDYLEYRISRVDTGEERWMARRGEAVIDEVSGKQRFIGVVYDITDRRRIEERLRESEAELQRLAESLETQVEQRTQELENAQDALRQAQKMEAVGQLTGGIAHDFNNLLTGILGGMDIVRRRIAAGRMDDIDRFLDAASTSANRAAALIHRLLAFSRRQSLDQQPIDVNQLASSMKELFSRTLGEDVTLDLQLAPDLRIADADPNQLESALLNLAINARDAMPGGGRLTVSTRNTRFSPAEVRGIDGLEPGEYVRIDVSDTGSGMPPDVMSRAFDPFFTTKPIGQGTGLGLSMIYGFAKQSRGHVGIESVEGRGTTVSLFLPRSAAIISDSDEAAAIAPMPRAAPGETILVVEDDDGVRQLVGEVLSDLGYGFNQASHADAAIELLRADGRIDLLITDVGLPGMDGRELAEIARVARPGLKILFITGYASKAALRGEFLLPGMDMITKPFKLDVLAAKVRQIIGA